MLFTIVTEEMLASLLPDSIIEKLGYEQGSVLKDKVVTKKELIDGTYAISVNLVAEGMRCAKTDLTEAEIAVAKDLYGEENLLSKEEYLKLEEVPYD